MCITPSTRKDTPGQIVKFMVDPSDPEWGFLTPYSFQISRTTQFKLKLYNGYGYVVEAGHPLNEVPQRPGRISRIALSNPTQRQISVDNLNNPARGLDIVNGQRCIFC